MIQARIHHGQVEISDSIPDSWEGQWVRIEPLTPDDPSPGIEDHLSRLHAMGPMEIEPDERAAISNSLAELDRISRLAMDRFSGPPS
jgi:hypothetical protein